MVEAAAIPAMLIFLTHWFSKAERGRADTFLILGNPVTLLWMSVVSGYIIAATSYRWMFIIEGLPAIAWAFIFRALAADRPRDAGWLDPAERDAIEARLADEQAGLPEVAGYRAAFTSRNVVILAVQYALWSIGVYGFVFWLPTIIKAGSAQGIGTTGLLSAGPYALGVLLMLAASWISDRTGRRRVFVWPFLLVATGAFYASYAVGRGDFGLSYALLIIAAGAMYAPYGPYFALIPELLPASVAGPAMGAVIGLTVMFVRRKVPESPRWLFIHGREDEAEAIVGGVEDEVEAATGQPLAEADKSITVRQRTTIPFREIARVAYRRYPRRAILCLALFVGQAFLYNAITFNLGT